MKSWPLFAALFVCGTQSPTDAITPADLGPQHQIKVLTQRAYLPGLPALVRVEVRNAQGRERELWDAEALLSANNGVTLSTNRVKLRNGLGSALVAFNGGGDFVLTATVGTLSSAKALLSVASVPITTVGGTLTGPNVVWSGVIRVTNDVTVPTGVTLTILSNTLVLLDGVTSGTTANDLLISGVINSLGTEDQPVTITCNSANIAARWGQIRHSTAQPSLYRYTSITRGGRAASEGGHTGQGPVLRPTNSRIRFESCNLTDYSEQVRGATGFGTPGKVMLADGSDLVFDDCLLSRARMGPEIAGTALLCTNTWIVDMPGPDDADGIYVHDQSAGQQVLFVDCVLADGDDDGIDTLGSIITVERCIIRDWDNLLEDAKGISVFNGATHVRRSLIVSSTVGIGAKWSSGPATLVTIDYCTFSQNLTNVWANFKPPGAPGPFIDFRITNSVLWGGDSVQSDFGPTNFTFGYCDISEPWLGIGNIMADPMFVNAGAHDYHLRPYSPCIDAGDPASPADPDGSPVDLGCFTFVPPRPILASPQRLADQTATFLLKGYTNRNYLIESSDALTNWTRLKTVPQTAPTTRVTDETAGASSHRVYRVRLAP
ncbi:MAG TPA: hypothetical protein VK850_18465 [Candidatus Binatia bacterium]|nr:hypothetical protein [Candidatus Binatia bacterium]